MPDDEMIGWKINRSNGKGDRGMMWPALRGDNSKALPNHVFFFSPRPTQSLRPEPWNIPCISLLPYNLLYYIL